MARSRLRLEPRLVRAAESGNRASLHCSFHGRTSDGAAQPSSEPASPPPSAISSATGSPLPDDARLAAALVDRYESALVDAEWPVAWSLLEPEARARWGSLGAYEAERAAYFASVHRQYLVGTARHDLAELTGWLPAGAPASAILGRSFLVQVDYPALSGNDAGWELFMATPDEAGGWRLWQLR
jgi:hypothetical protein